MSRTVKIVLVVVTLSVGLILIVCGGGGMLIYSAFQRSIAPPEDIRVQVSVPQEIEAGRSLTIEVLVLNRADRAQTLDSIDVYDTYLAGVNITGSDPPWRSSSSYFDFISYDYGRAIPAGGQLVVTLDATAMSPGDYRGDLDVCINGPASCMSNVLRTMVTAADR